MSEQGWVGTRSWTWLQLLIALPLVLLPEGIGRDSVMETLDSTELFMEDQTWLDYLWDFETRGINLDLPSDTD